MNHFTRLFVSTIFTFIIVYPFISRGQNVTLSGRWTDGTTRAMCFSGTNAYYGNGGSLISADISDPANPMELSKVNLPALASSIKIKNNYAYVVSYGEELSVIDISNPNHIVKVGSFYETTYRFTHSLVINGDKIYLSGNYDGICILDISEPTNPVKVGNYNINDMVRTMTIDGNFLYLGFLGGLMQILDISTPLQPEQIGEVKNIKGVSSITVTGNLALVNGHNNWFSIIDVSAPDSPFIKGSCELDDHGYLANTAIVNGYVYVSKVHGGFYIVDISDPSNPVKKDYVFDNYVGQLVFENQSNLFLSTYGFGVRVIDVSNPLSPYDKAFLPSGDLIYGFCVNNKKAYIAYHERGLQIVDFSDPDNPITRGSLEVDTWARDIATAGNYVYMTNYSEGLHVIDVSNPDNPVVTGLCNLGNDCNQVEVSGNYAYVLKRTEGMKIIDISDPYNPVEKGSFDPGSDSHSYYSIAVSNGYAYVYFKREGISIIDVSDAENPKEVSFLSENVEYAGNFDVTVNGDYLYWSGTGLDGGLQIVNIAIPEHPQIVYNGMDHLGKLTVWGDYLYSETKDYTVAVIDITDKSNPVIVGDFKVGDFISGIAIKRNIFYVAGISTGIYVLKNELASGIEIAKVEKGLFNLSVYPNPVQNRAIISYTLSADSEVIIEATDISGKKIDVLQNRFVAAGNHSIQWNSANTAPGVYFISIKADNLTETRKIIIE